MIKLEKEYWYYIDHREELVKKYLNKYIVIKDKEILGSFDSAKEALDKTKTDYKIGTFLIKKVLHEKDEPIANFYSRVYG